MDLNIQQTVPATHSLFLVISRQVKNKEGQ